MGEVHRVESVGECADEDVAETDVDDDDEREWREAELGGEDKDGVDVQHGEHEREHGRDVDEHEVGHHAQRHLNTGRCEKQVQIMVVWNNAPSLKSCSKC